jgi:hypothetical protein
VVFQLPRASRAINIVHIPVLAVTFWRGWFRTFILMNPFGTNRFEHGRTPPTEIWEMRMIKHWTAHNQIIDDDYSETKFIRYFGQDLEILNWNFDIKVNTFHDHWSMIYVLCYHFPNIGIWRIHHLGCCWIFYIVDWLNCNSLRYSFQFFSSLSLTS